MTLTGCGPIEYISQVSFKATAAVRAAHLAHADQVAPYEMTAAEEYLLKAREEAGRSEYQAAIRFGEKAEELANKARAMALTPKTPAPAATHAETAATAPAAPAPAAPASAPAAPAGTKKTAPAALPAAAPGKGKSKGSTKP